MNQSTDNKKSILTFLEFNLTNIQWIKLTIIIFLSLCLFELNLPLGYFQFMKVTLSVLFTIMAIFYYKEQQNFLNILLCIIGAALFNPFQTLKFDKHEWLIIDQFTLGILAIWLVFELKVLDNIISLDKYFSDKIKLSSYYRLVLSVLIVGLAFFFYTLIKSIFVFEWY